MSAPEPLSEQRRAEIERLTVGTGMAFASLTGPAIADLLVEVDRLRAITERPDPRRWVSVEDANRVLAEERAAHEATAAALNDARAITEAAERWARAQIEVWLVDEADPDDVTAQLADIERTGIEAEQAHNGLLEALGLTADPVRLPEPEPGCYGFCSAPCATCWPDVTRYVDQQVDPLLAANKPGDPQ